MKKSALVLVLSAFLSVLAFGQNIQEGVKHLYAERKTSAKSTFEKLLAANPNNIEAVYWLGQAHIAENNPAAARQVYEKAMGTNGNAPLLLVGMGHVELIEGKKAEARQRFETAISLSRGKKGDDPVVLNAIGRANVEGKNGDIAYAIAKLNDAAKKAPNNDDIFINLGNAYRKARDGNQAAASYMAATRVAAGNPVPYYRLALLYKTQRNWDIVNENLNKAVSVDSRFAPAYLQMYDYNLRFKKDFNEAEKIANQYIAASDPSVQNDYLKAQTNYMQKKYDEAISLGKNIIAQSGESVQPRVYRLLAYSSLDKGDTVGARPYVQKFFQTAEDDDIVPLDYLLQAYVFLKDDPSMVRSAIEQGLKADTLVSNQLAFLSEVIDAAKVSGLKLVEADARFLAYQLKGTRASSSELIQVGLPYYYAGQFKKADSLFAAYSAVNPDSIYGYLWSARSLSRIDTAGTQGLAMDAYDQLLRTAALDKERLKSYGLEAVTNLAPYYVNVKRDREKGIFYLNKGLEFDPNNETFKVTIERLKKAPAKSQATKQSSSTGAKAKPAPSTSQVKKA